MRLHLGVIEVPHGEDGSLTTGDLAEILEAKYGIMEAFFKAHEQEIADLLVDGFEGSLETLLLGGPMSADMFAGACSKIDRLFKRFLSSREVETVGIPGTPTEAALRGVSHRRKRPYVKANPRRPSFIDTGQYQASFRSWVDRNGGGA